MSRVAYTPLSLLRDASELMTIFTALDTASDNLNAENLLRDSIDRRLMPDRPVWQREGHLAITTRNAATLASAFPVWATLVHDGTDLEWTFAGADIDDGEALRFSAWISFESTFASGVGIEGDLLLRWFRTDTAAKLVGTGARIQRGDTASAGDSGGNQHGQVYLEGWIVGPITLTADVRVEFSYDNGAGADAFVSRSIIAYDRFFRYLEQ